jgi:hypothetical protein
LSHRSLMFLTDRSKFPTLVSFIRPPETIASGRFRFSVSDP